METGVKVLDVDVDESTLSLEDERTVTADLIVAADGVHVSSLHLGRKVLMKQTSHLYGHELWM